MEEALIEVPNSTKNKDGKQDPEIHQAKKGNQWYFGMKVHAGVDKDSGLIHSVVLMAANVHDLTPAAELLQGDEEEVYGIAAGFCEAVAGYQGIAQRPEMASTGVEFRVGMRPGKRRGLPDMPDGRPLDLIETTKTHIRAKVEHPFRVIKQQFGFQKTRLRGLARNRCSINALAALTNPFLARRQLLVTA